MKSYYEENKEKLLAYQIEYNRVHKKEITEYGIVLFLLFREFDSL